MQPLRLAILWTLNDRRIICELSKVGLRAWQIRVVSDGEELRSAVLNDLSLTLRTALNWRDEWSRKAKIA